MAIYTRLCIAITCCPNIRFCLHRYAIYITLRIMERLNQDIKNNNFQKLYLLYGSETYLRRNYMKSLKKAIIGDDDMNYSYFEGDGTDIKAFIELSETMPFFSDKRLIILENTGLVKSGGDELSEYLKQIPDYLYVIMVEAEIDKRTKLYKTFNSKGTAVEMNPLTGEKQAAWITGILSKSGKKMTVNDIGYLVSLTGDDMVNIQSELEKLINYVGDRQIINAGDAEQIVTRQIGDHIFKMVDAMGKRDQSQALGYYYDLLAKREPAFKILALVIRQFNLILQAKELSEKRYTDKDIASKIGVNPYFVKDYIRQGRNFDFDTLYRALEACAQADEDIKFGKMSDKLSVELLIIEFSK